MPSQIAALVYLVLILALFYRDSKLRPLSSPGLWIALAWIAIVGSRPVSTWFGGGIVIETPEDYLEGSPVDRAVFLGLIAAGCAVLLSRRLSWSRLFASNGWLIAFLIYCGMSVLWSDHPYVGFKRWTKDIGNVVMILVILTQSDPVAAFKAVFARFTYLAVPLSMLLIKYFPDLGRYYNRWTWEPAFSGVTTNKNELGAVLFVCGLVLVWDYLDRRKSGAAVQPGAVDHAGRVILLLMLVWLVLSTRSMTALVCLLFGSALLFMMNRPFGRGIVRHLGGFSLLAAGAVLVVLFLVPDVFQSFMKMAGRDATFTGRTELWADLVQEPINPLFGTGYNSFWLGAGALRMWERYSFHPVQAHNGYLETYLNGGLMGVLLLLLLIISSVFVLKKELLAGSSFAMLRFSFLAVALLYNWTEAMFTGLSIVWFMMLIAVLRYARPPAEAMEGLPQANTFRLLSGREPSRRPMQNLPPLQQDR